MTLRIASDFCFASCGVILIWSATVNSFLAMKLHSSTRPLNRRPRLLSTIAIAGDGNCLIVALGIADNCMPPLKFVIVLENASK